MMILFYIKIKNIMNRKEMINKWKYYKDRWQTDLSLSEFWWCNKDSNNLFLWREEFYKDHIPEEYDDWWHWEMSYHYGRLKKEWKVQVSYKWFYKILQKYDFDLSEISEKDLMYKTTPSRTIYIDERHYYQNYDWEKAPYYRFFKRIKLWYKKETAIQPKKFKTKNNLNIK